MPIQTTYRERIDPARPGLINGSDYDTVTGIVETAAGIAAGLAVGSGVGDKGIVLGGALGIFRGITVRDVTLAPATAQDKYPQYANAGVLTRGLIWVVPAVAVAAGDPVHYVSATGVLTNTGDIGPVLGARWASSAGAGEYAMVHLGGYDQN